jgi:predicted Zn-dependent peptidase
MIHYEKFTLDNGLRVLVHKDESTPMAVVNVIYDVGARDENPDKTGFAHLFEHLMFGGSINIPEYDEPLQMAGVLPTIIVSCLPKILKPLFGWKVIVC